MPDTTSRRPPDDAAVLRVVGLAFDEALPPIPDHLSQFAATALRWRTVGDIGELLSDSALEDAVGVRGASSRRAISFSMGRYHVLLDIADAIVHVTIDPPVALACLLETTDSAVEVSSNEHGRITANVHGLPLRLRMDTDDGVVTSPWVIG